MSNKIEKNFMSNGSDNGNSNKKKNFPGGGSQKPDGDFDWSKVIKAVLSWGAVIIVAVVIMRFAGGDASSTTISYNEYKKLLAEDKIAKIKVVKTGLNDFTLDCTLKTEEKFPVGNNYVSTQKVSVVSFEKKIEEDSKVWEEKQIQYTVEKESNEWMNIFIGFLPWILILGLWFFFMRKMQGGGGGSRGLFNFGKSKAKLISESSIKVTFKDVAGADEAKSELQEIIEFLKEPAKFQKLGGKIPRGVLLLGPPGTGKTLLARAVAGEAGVPFFSISGADFVEMFVGVGASRVRDLFEQGKKNAPCIIFIDEIDAVGRHRGAGLGGGHDEREQTLNQLLVEMDGFEQNSGVIIIAATNRPDVLDPALLRPGRFDRQVVVDRPDVTGREGILKVHTRKIPLDKDVDLLVLAKGTPGLAGAELANLANEAALHAARKNKKNVSMDDFEEAKDKVMMGMERKSLIISEEEKKLTSYHEIGHVLVARMIPEADPVHKVTIIPRGRALGVTTYLPVDEKHTYTKEYLEAMITYAEGGRAAEKIVFARYTTGAGNDIDKATKIARKMVCEWGMSETLGPVSFGKNEEEIFLGREVTRHKDFSEETAREIDREIKGIINKGMARAEKILSENIELLHKLSLELLEREILDSDEIDKITKGVELPPAKKVNGTSSADAVPEHVKKLLEEREMRSNPSTQTENTEKKNDVN